jgi:hypothetical protein
MLMMSYKDTDEYKIFKQFVNTLHCPLCDSQLDGNIHRTANLYCASNNKEYSSFWQPGKAFPDVETITFWYTQYQYVVSIYWQVNDTFSSSIDRYNLDASEKFRASTRVRLFHLEERLTAFHKRMEEEEFLKKIQIYKVFS